MLHDIDAAAPVDGVGARRIHRAAEVDRHTRAPRPAATLRIAPRAPRPTTALSHFRPARVGEQRRADKECPAKRRSHPTPTVPFIGEVLVIVRIGDHARYTSNDGKDRQQIASQSAGVMSGPSASMTRSRRASPAQSGQTRISRRLGCMDDHSSSDESSRQANPCRRMVTTRRP